TVISFRDVLRLDDARTGVSRVVDRHPHLAELLRCIAPRAPHLRKLCHTPDVALAPRGDAVADPVLLGGNPAVELVTLAFLFLQQLVAPCFVGCKAAIEPEGAPTVEPERRARQVLQETPVVADEHQRAAHARKLALE